MRVLALQLEQAVKGVLETANERGDAIYLAVAFGVFVIVAVSLFGFALRTIVRDFARGSAAAARENREALSEAYALVRAQNDAHLAEQRELAKCTQQGLNGALLSIQQTNAGLVHAGMQMVAKLEPVLHRNVELCSRVERVLDVSSRLNGHAG